MRDSTASLKAAEKINSAQLSAYLVKNSWTIAPSKLKNVAVVSKSFPDMTESVYFPLPLDDANDDARSRIAGVLRILAGLEQRSEYEIATDVADVTQCEPTGKKPRHMHRLIWKKKLLPESMSHGASRPVSSRPSKKRIA